MDAVWEDIPRQTAAYDYTRKVFDASVAFDLAASTSLGFGYTRDEWDRTHREVENAHEDSLSINLDHRAGGKVNVNARYQYGKRSTSEYFTEAQHATFVHEEDINNQPGLRKFDEAEREFHAGRIMAHFMPSDTVELALGLNARKDDYDKSLFGLAKDQQVEFNVELNFNPQPGVNLFVFGSIADREVFQRARQSGGSLSTREIDDWEVTFDETTNTWGGGFNGRNGAVSLDTTASWTKADGKASFFSPPGGSPDTAEGYGNYDDSEWLVFKAKLGYDWNQKVSCGLGYWYEHYDTSRFGVDGISSYVPGAVLLAGNDGAFDANIVYVDMTFRF
jgi:hypothetical protein